MGPSPVLGMDAVALMIIDAILVNKVASCAVVSAEVLSNFNTQHRPLRVELSWKRVWQCGYVLHKTAPFVFDLPPVDPGLPTMILSTVGIAQISLASRLCLTRAPPGGGDLVQGVHLFSFAPKKCVLDRNPMA